MGPVQGTYPRKIGPYRIRGLLGAGGMGRVYLGVDKNKHWAAVKVVNAELLRNEEFRKRFIREATATAKVDGRFIAGIVASDLDGAHPWLATEYIKGTSLSELVAAQGSPLEAADAQQMAAGLAEALTTIHAAGVVHRDVKPANVLLAEHDGQLIPHLIDFGIARGAAFSTITLTGIVVGTPPYMAPEQIQGKREVGPPADVFALGGVLTFAVTGRHPFGEGDPATLSYRITHQEPDLDGVEDALIRKLIMACLAKEPQDRPTAPDLQEQIGNLATRRIPPEVPAPRAEAGAELAELVRAPAMLPMATGAEAKASAMTSPAPVALATEPTADEAAGGESASKIEAEPAPSPAPAPAPAASATGDQSQAPAMPPSGDPPPADPPGTNRRPGTNSN
ncbi:serine/threonine protein kinase, partial [Catenulispora sp. NF23]|uniref:serine/threonine-protein kinase n=1 Tax=Catenulispora pinistramenti TaxID=2705254 RepID=UPI001BA8D30D